MNWMNLTDMGVVKFVTMVRMKYMCLKIIRYKTLI